MNRMMSQPRVTVGLIIVVVCVEAFMYGYSYPLFSLVLSQRGISKCLIGLNAALATGGILIIGPIIPSLICKHGLKNVTLTLFVVSILSFLAILLSYENVYFWFLCRFFMGTCFLSLWITTEVWLNAVAADSSRVRILSFSGTSYALFQFVGPCVLDYQTIISIYPLCTSIGVLSLGVVATMLASEPSPLQFKGDAVKHGDYGFRQAFGETGILFFVVCLTGITEIAMQSLLPVYALSSGYSTGESTKFVAIFSLGEALLAGLLGYAADRNGRFGVLITTISLAIVVLGLMPIADHHGIYVIGPLLFLGGGVTSGLYTLSVVIIGQEYKGNRLSTIASGFIMGYAAGGTAGPVLLGYLMDLYSPQALPFCLMLMFLPLLWLLTRYYRDGSLRYAVFYSCLQKLKT